VYILQFDICLCMFCKHTNAARNFTLCSTDLLWHIFMQSVHRVPMQVGNGMQQMPCMHLGHVRCCILLFRFTQLHSSSGQLIQRQLNAKNKRQAKQFANRQLVVPAVNKQKQPQVNGISSFSSALTDSVLENSIFHWCLAKKCMIFGFSINKPGIY